MWQYNYDPDGNLILSTDANDRATSDSFDLLGEPTGRTLPNEANSQTRTSYAAGNLLSLKHFNGDTTTYSLRQPEPAADRDTGCVHGRHCYELQCTPTGQRATMIGAKGTTTYTYDSLELHVNAHKDLSPV